MKQQPLGPIVFEPTTQTTHWCRWCREHPEKAADPFWSAVSYNQFTDVKDPVLFLAQGSPQMHLHEAIVIGGPDTVAAAIRRLYLRKSMKARAALKRWFE